MTKRFFSLYICCLGCNQTIIIDGIASQTVYWQICLISRWEYFSMWALTTQLYFFLSVASIGELRGRRKQVSCLKIKISANIEISYEMTRLSCTQLPRSNNLTEGKMSYNIFLCLPATSPPLIYTVFLLVCLEL